MSTKGLFLLQMASAMASVDDVYNPYHQERVRRENEEHRKQKEANAKRMSEINRKRFVKNRCPILSSRGMNRGIFP